MLKIIIVFFLFLHGMVSLLYAGQAIRLFELRPGMSWPDGSWAFSRLFSKNKIRLTASISCLLTSLGFITASLAIILKWMWWSNAVVYSACFSSFLFIFLWDGRIRRLDDQGGIGILINLVMIISLSFFNWPDFSF